jgi:hypothetical protein
MQSESVGPDIKRRSNWGAVRPWSLRGGCPAAWTDPLDLYGSFRMELTPPRFDASAERAYVRGLIRLHGPGWVWSNRQRLVSLRKFVSRVQSGRIAR